MWNIHGDDHFDLVFYSLYSKWPPLASMQALKDAPAHRAKETVDLLSNETPAFIPPSLWPPNSLDLNLVDYKVWSVLQEQVYKVKVNDVDELHQRIQTGSDELDQCIIDKAIIRPRACVEAKGGHFEHTNFKD